MATSLDQPPAAFRTVRRGVHLIRLAVVLILASGVIAVACQTAAANLKDGDKIKGLLQFGRFAGVFQGGFGLFYLIGVCCCCFVPKKSEARKWARALAICLWIAVLLIAAIAAARVALHGRQEWQPALEFLTHLFRLVGLAVSICLFPLLAAVARHFGNPKLGAWLVVYLVGWVCIALVGVVVGVLTFAVSPGVPVGAVPGANASVGAAWGGDAVALARLLGWGGGSVAVAVLGWSELIVQTAMALWLVVLLTRLYRLIPAPARQGNGRPDHAPAR